MKIIILISFIILVPFAVFSQSCLPEGIAFNMQSQIDLFQFEYPGCTRIEGNVSIGSSSDITNLEGLSMLNSIGGNLEIINNTYLTNLTGLENLDSIGGDLDIRYNQSLENVTGLQNISASSIHDLSIIDNPCLTDCNVQCLCDYLSGPDGMVSIYNNGAGCSNPPDIARSCNIQMPCLPFGNYYFTTQADINSFSADYPGCSRLTSFIDISGNDIYDLSGLSGITCIDGTFSVSDNYVLNNLEGLDNLDSITEHFFISYNESLNNLAGLDSLSFIGGSLIASFNPALISLDGLNGLDTVAGNIEIHDNENLASVDGLNAVTAVKCHLLIENNPELHNLDGLGNLNSVNLRLHISGNSSLNNITGLSKLAYLGDELWMGYNDNLHDLSGLESLDSIGGNLVIKANNSLTSLSGLDSITSIGGYLEIGDNDALESLQALLNLSSIDGGMMIYMNDGLSSLSGLDNIHAGSIIDLLIDNNSLLSTCEVNSICDYLSNPYGPANIENNAEGCDSRDEVLEACVAGVNPSVVGSRQSAVIVYPNPTGGIVDFRFSVFGFRKVNLMLFDVQGREIATLLDEVKPTGEVSVTFDASTLAPGIYFYRLTSANSILNGKLIVSK